MKVFKRIVSVMLIAALMLTVLPMGTLADSLREGAENTAVIKNDYIKVVVNKSNGRFAVRTVDGQPIRKNDQNLNMSYDEDDTSFTTFRITSGGYTGDYIFGNGYDLEGGNNLKSALSEPVITTDEQGNQKLTTTWTLTVSGGTIAIDQIITLNASTDTDKAGMVFVDYKVNNTTGADIQVGTRVLLDTMVGVNDGPAYQNGTTQENVTTVERTMVRNVAVGAEVDGVTIDNTNKNYYDIANYFMMRDSGSYTDPLATNIYAYGFNSVNIEVDGGSALNTALCDRIVVGHWAHMANSKYDIEVDPHLDFTTDTNKYGTADSAVAYFWNPVSVANNTIRSYRVVYGLGEITYDNSEFQLTFIDQKFQLETNDAKTAYLGDGIFEIAVQVQCSESSEMQHSQVEATLTLGRDLKFVKTVNGQVVYENGKPVTLPGRSLSSTYQKSKTSVDQEVNYFAAGDMCVFRYKVLAEGRAWPTTQEYMIQVTSPEMKQKAAAENKAFTVEDTSSIRSDFILLPAIGEMMQSRAYSVAPEQAYYSDEKIISVGMTNFGAYTLGEAGENKDYPNRNFNVYLQNVLTGDRYLVHPADISLVDKDGATGIMNIDYTGGRLISASVASPYEVKPDASTNNPLASDPTLPVGKYAIEVKFMGDNAEQAELLSFTSDAQIDVNTLKESRLRTGGYLVVARRYKSLSSADYEKYNKIVNALNNASLKIDKNGAVYNTQKTGTLVPYYDVQVFANEADLEEYKNAIKPYTEYNDNLGWTTEMNWNRGEVLLEIKGKVKATTDGYIVDTAVEPAVINRTVTYQGETLTLSKEILTESFKNNAEFATEYCKLLGANTYTNLSEAQKGKLNDSFQLYHWTLNGNGNLAVSGAKYTFYNQKWNIDLYDGFAKTLFLNDRVDEYTERFTDSNIYDVSTLTATTKGYKDHLNGLTYEQANPMEMIAEGDVYFNQLGIVPAQNYNPGSMQLELVDFRLNSNKGSYQLRMGGFVNMSIFRGDIDEVSFDSKGYYGTDANIGFDIWKDIGILKAATKYYGGGYDDSQADTTNQMASGGRFAEAGAALLVRNYREYTRERQGLIAMSGKFKLPVLGGFYVGFTFKEVPSGLILPDCFAFQYFAKSDSTEVDGQRQAIPGIQIAPNTYMTRVRVAVRNLADTVYGIATGENVGSMPLQLAGGITVSIPMGLGSVASRIALIGNIDMLLKMTGLKITGSLELELWLVSVPLVNLAEIQIQWQSPAFLSAKILIDIADLGVLVGKGALFIGERENGKFDFDAYANAAVKIPSKVPVVGGLSLARAFFGINLERITGGFTIIPFVSVCLSYYYGGDIDFWVESDGTAKEDALAYIIHTDEDTGTQSLISIGQNISYVATSDYDPETAGQQLVYRSHIGADEMLIYRSAGLGGITVDGTTYTIPVGTKVHDSNKPADALVEIEYLDEMPTITSAKIDGADRAVVPYETSVDELGNTVYKVPANAPENALYSYTLERDMDGTTQKLLYITVPYERFNSSSNLTLTLSENADMALLKVGRTSELTDVSLTQNGNQLTMTATAKNAKAGDTVKFFLTPDGNGNKLTTETINGKTVQVEDQGTLGMLVGTANIENTTAVEQTVTATINDITNCEILGKSGVNLNELLNSGNYYLRAILDSGNTQSEKQTANAIELKDPKAPQPVTDAKLEVGGNGQLKVSFKPGDDKADSFVLNFYDENGNDWSYYTDLLVSRDDLTKEADGYYSYTLGAWSEQTIEKVDKDNKVTTEVTYSGFQTEKTYKAKVKAATTEIVDGGEKYHFSALTDYTNLVFLPEPVEPKLTISGATEYYKHADGDYRTEASDTFAYYSLTTNKAEPTITVKTDCDATFKLFDGGEKVEFYVGDSTEKVTETTLTAETETTIRIAGFGENDATTMLSAFVRNNETKDTAIKSVRLTADYTAPTLYIDAPVPGAVAENGMVDVSGITNAEDSVVTVYVDDSTTGTVLDVDENGNFYGFVALNSANSTAKLTFVASDAAGNTNTAVVTVQNGDYEVAQNIVLRTFKSGNTTKVETVARYAAGKEGGMMTYNEKVVKDGVKYSTYKGDVSVENGNVTFGSSDSGIISATYNTPDGAVLTAMTVVRKDGGANTQPSNPSQPAGPTGGGSSAGGGASSGSADEGKISAEESRTEVDKTAVDVTLDENGIVTIDATEGESVKSELDAKGYRILNTPGSDLEVDTPIFKASLPASVLGDKGEMTVTALDKADVKSSGADSAVLSATLVELGGNGDIKAPVTASFAIPDTVSVDDVTAVILYDGTGKMTPLPFKLNMIGDKAFVDVVLTDEGTVVLESCKASFSDVKETDWAYKDIMSAAKREILKGLPDGTFNRTGVCSRSEFATILMRTLGMMTQETDTVLKDVNKNAWDYEALAVAKDLGIITGYPDGSIGGANPVSRVEAMVMVGRALKALGITEELTASEIDGILSGFTDGAEVPEWAKASVALCIKNGIINGAGGKVDCASKLSREQCAAIANRLDGVIVKTLLK